MGGRRCIIINRAAQTPTTVPTGLFAKSSLERHVRTVCQNTSVAGELAKLTDYQAVINALASDPMSATELQFVLDKLNSFPDTEG